jgi:hypothetical protein
MAREPEGLIRSQWIDHPDLVGFPRAVEHLHYLDLRNMIHSSLFVQQKQAVETMTLNLLWKWVSNSVVVMALNFVEGEVVLP